MKSYFNQISISTSGKIELKDITNDIRLLLEKSKISDGILLVYSPHTTTAIIVNENESGLVRDIESAVKSLIPWEKNYIHNSIDTNAASHIAGAFIGNSASLIIENSKLVLGTWQSVFFLEMDGPRSRQVKIKIIGE
ncbi:MAG: YjbQ family protein [Actinobacteria bacterium]|nr:YjbQ family protein [Actinomycetota bacterium]